MFRQSHWQPVFQTHNESEAQFIAGMLETRGIMARLLQEPVAKPKGQSHTILVDARDFEQARTFLRHEARQLQ